MTRTYFSRHSIPKAAIIRIIENLYLKKFSLLISTPILLEYEEILQRVFPERLLEQFWLFLLTSENIVFVNPTYNFQIPFADEDDQKFVDCAVCGNAHFLITNDKHFNMLKDIEFPKVKVITGENFIREYL